MAARGAKRGASPRYQAALLKCSSTVGVLLLSASSHVNALPAQKLAAAMAFAGKGQSQCLHCLNLCDLLPFNKCQQHPSKDVHRLRMPAMEKVSWTTLEDAGIAGEVSEPCSSCSRDSSAHMQAGCVLLHHCTSSKGRRARGIWSCLTSGRKQGANSACSTPRERLSTSLGNADERSSDVRCVDSNGRSDHSVCDENSD